MDEPVRVDKWLWAARFFKTRGKAREAVVGGKVHLNGNRVKPARTLQIGDRLRILRGEEEFLVEVQGLSDRRGPAPEARELYAEDEDSRQRREAAARERALRRSQRVGRERRPDKRERRRIIRFRRELE